jgi:hypothetical protein
MPSRARRCNYENSGSLIIGLRVKIDKDNPLVFESEGSGPWNLVDGMER